MCIGSLKNQGIFPSNTSCRMIYRPEKWKENIIKLGQCDFTVISHRHNGESRQHVPIVFSLLFCSPLLSKLSDFLTLNHLQSHLTFLEYVMHCNQCSAILTILLLGNSLLPIEHICKIIIHNCLGLGLEKRTGKSFLSLSITNFLKLLISINGALDILVCKKFLRDNGEHSSSNSYRNSKLSKSSSYLQKCWWDRCCDQPSLLWF